MDTTHFDLTSTYMGGSIAFALMFLVITVVSMTLIWVGSSINKKISHIASALGYMGFAALFITLLCSPMSIPHTDVDTTPLSVAGLDSIPYADSTAREQITHSLHNLDSTMTVSRIFYLRKMNKPEVRACQVSRGPEKKVESGSWMIEKKERTLSVDCSAQEPADLTVKKDPLSDIGLGD